MTRVSSALVLLLAALPLCRAEGMAEAQRALRAHHPEQALEALEKAPDSPAAAFWRGRALLELRRYSEAVSWLRQVPEGDALFPYAAKALMFCARECPKVDVESCLMPLTASKDAEVARLAAALLAEHDLLNGLGSESEVAELLERAWPEGVESAPERRLLEVYRLARVGHFDEALALCRMLEAQPGLSTAQRHRVRLAMAEVYYGEAERGEASERVSAADKAEETLLQFISANPDSPLLEEAFRRLNRRHAFATSDYASSKLVEWATDTPRAHRSCLALQELQAIYNLTPDDARALALVNTAQSFFPHEPATRRILLEQTRRLLAAGQDAQAEPYLQSLKEDDPYRLFFAAGARGSHPQEALPLYLKAAEQAPEELRRLSLVNALYCALQLEDEQTARRLFGMPGLSTETRAAMLSTGALYLAQKSPEAARRMLEVELQLPLGEAERTDAMMDLAAMLLSSQREHAAALISEFSRADLRRWRADQLLRYAAFTEELTRAEGREKDEDGASTARRILPEFEALMHRPGTERVAAELRLAHAALLCEAGREAEAVSELGAFLRETKVPELRARAYLALAQAYDRFGTSPARRMALAYLNRCEQISSRYRREALALKAHLLTLTGKAEEARRLLEKELGDQQHPPDALDRARLCSSLADAWALEQSPDAGLCAIRALEDALGDRRLPVRWLFRLRLHHAALCLRYGYTPQAIEDFEAILDADPLAERHHLASGPYVLYAAGAGEVTAWLEEEDYERAAEVAERVADRVSSAETSEKAARYATRLRNWAKQIRRMHPSD